MKGSVYDAGRNIHREHMQALNFITRLLTFKAAFDNSCNDGFSLLQALSHSAIPSEERNLQMETIVLSVEATTVLQTDCTPFRSM